MSHPVNVSTTLNMRRYRGRDMAGALGWQATSMSAPGRGHVRSGLASVRSECSTAARKRALGVVWERVRARERVLGEPGLSEWGVATVWTPAKPLWFAFDLQEKGCLDLLADGYMTVLDGKTCLNRAVRTYADNLRVNVKDSLRAFSTPCCKPNSLSVYGRVWTYS